MHYSRRQVVNTMLVTAIILLLVNISAFSYRSSWPVGFDGVVSTKFILTEDRPGIDDLCYVEMQDGRKILVERNVYDLAEPGKRLRKGNFSTVVLTGDSEVDVGFPKFLLWFFAGMILVTGLVFFMFFQVNKVNKLK